MIFETVVNHQQAQPVTEGRHAGMIRYTGYLYATEAEAERLGRPVGVYVVRLAGCTCDPPGSDQADCGVHGTDRARGEYG